MLYGSTVNQPYRILAIDPGTDTLGVSIFDVDLVNGTKTLLTAFTFQASKYIDTLLDNNQWNYQDEKYLRLHRHGEHLYGLLLQYRPHLVCHESAFMGRFPKAYQGLVECLLTLKLATKRYSPFLPFIGITPMEVKHYIGGVKKDEVLNAVTNITDLINLQQILPTLDEHAVDSIAIGYTVANQLLSSFSWDI